MNDFSSKDKFFANAPRDKFRFAYLAFFLQGVAMFLAWNVFFTAAEFFSFRFTDSTFTSNYANYFAFGFMIANMLFVTLGTARQHKANFARQLFLSSVGNLFIFIALSILTLATNISPTVTFYVSLFLFFLSGVTCAYMQISCFAISARWEPIYVQAICSGQGFSGAATALAPLVVALVADPATSSTPESIATRALIVFVLCGIVIIIAYLAYFVLQRTDIYSYYMNNAAYNEWGFDKEPKRLQGGDIMHVVRRTSLLAIAQAWVWLVSLSLFPAVTGGVNSYATGPGALQGRWADKAIFVGLHYLVYNCGDWTGRILTGLSRFFVSTSPIVIVTVALLRTAFVPLFMMCNAEKPSDGSNPLLPTLINSDLGYFAVLLAFAISNGWTSSCAFMAAPSKMNSPEEEEVAGIVQSFTMSLGSTFGSLGGFGVRGLFVCKCNPFIS